MGCVDKLVVTVGIDIGSATSKTVVMKDEDILGYVILPSGTDWKGVTELSVEKAFEKANVSFDKVDYIMSTGYGRRTVDIANKTVTEITAFAEGTKRVHESIRTIVDVGGQDSKVIALDEKGIITGFQMNDRCAAGTGRFLEHMAHVLGVPIEDLGRLALISKKPANITSTCTVFAETEVISLLAQGWKKEDIIAGLHESIVKRLISMAKQVGVEEEVMFCGGVAKNVGVRKALETVLGTKVYVPDEPQIVGAIGAALLAQKEMPRFCPKCNAQITFDAIFCAYCGHKI